MTSCNGVGIFAERAGVTFRENFHHPPIKVIHWMVHDGFKSTVVFAMSFLNVVFQPDAQVFFLPPRPPRAGFNIFITCLDTFATPFRPRMNPFSHLVYLWT